MLKILNTLSYKISKVMLIRSETTLTVGSSLTRLRTKPTSSKRYYGAYPKCV
ncbi:hypothetical protein HanRHA438_Chr01g0025961 [Helianthus annuus]|nr:hypothetical protein HanRHA438_Chr01g0025961 [Helianthus annuus]